MEEQEPEINRFLVITNQWLEEKGSPLRIRLNKLSFVCELGLSPSFEIYMLVKEDSTIDWDVYEKGIAVIYPSDEFYAKIDEFADSLKCWINWNKNSRTMGWLMPKEVEEKKPDTREETLKYMGKADTEGEWWRKKESEG